VPKGDLQQGDVVSVSIPAYSSYVSTFVIFVLPLLLFMAGAAVGWMAERRTTSDDLPMVLGGLCGFALGVVIAVIVNHMMSNVSKLDVQRPRQTRG
jgi:positive regulator of sigma E activity